MRRNILKADKGCRHNSNNSCRNKQQLNNNSWHFRATMQHNYHQDNLISATKNLIMPEILEHLRQL